ncbi:MAG: T9SS type A sorting domain-containing protein [bacterium]
MKYIIALFTIFIFAFQSSGAKWTVLDSTNSAINKQYGWADGIVFDIQGGYFFQGYSSVDTKYRIFSSIDRGFTWNNILDAKGGWDSLNGKVFCHFLTNSLSDKCLTNKFLYLAFNCVDENINSDATKYTYHKINDSTLTKNAVILRMDRSTNKCEMIDTKILDRIKGLKMLDDNFGIIVGHKSVYRTVDGCRTFSKIFTSDTIAGWFYIDFSVPTKNDYYILSRTDGKRLSKIYYTNDAGVNWNSKQIPDSSYYIESIGPGKVFLLNILKYRTRLLYTEDNFESYISVLDTVVRDQGAKGNILIKDSLYYISYSTQANTFISFNKGKSWITADSTKEIGYPPETFLKDGAIVDDKTIAIISLCDNEIFIYEKNNPVSVREMPKSGNSILIYPNPLPRSVPLNINFRNIGNYSKCSIKIIDITGKTVDEFYTNNIRADINLQYLPDADIPRGTYFLVIDSDEGIIAKEKFIFE